MLNVPGVLSRLHMGWNHSLTFKVILRTSVINNSYVGSPYLVRSPNSRSKYREVGMRQE